MSSNITNYGDISPRTGGFAKAQLLAVGQNMLVTERFGQIDPLQKNKTKTSKWRRYNTLPRATAPLAEGVTPKGHKLTSSDVNVTLEQYGDIVEVTDVVADTHEDPVLKVAMDRCGQQAGESIEEVRINTLKAGTNVFYAANVTSRSLVNSPPTRGDLRRIYRSFKINLAREITSIIPATPKISTEPVAPAFFAMGHTDLDADITNISGFTPVEQYSSSMKAVPGEIGKIEHFRFILTAMFDSWPTSGLSGTTYLSNGIQVTVGAQADVYPLIFVSKDAYGIVPLQGFNSIDIGVISPGKKTKSDPMGQRGMASWKTYQACVILNQNWMCRLECCATANPA